MNEQDIKAAVAKCVLDTCKALPEHRDAVRVVGKWVWIEFASKPKEDVRTALKGLGYRWNRKRSVGGGSTWQNSCGSRGYRFNDKEDPKAKYGAVGVVSFAEGLKA